MGIIVVGLGPGSGKLLTREAWAILTAGDEVYLRTRRHPAVADLPRSVNWHSFDHVYEQGESFAAVYRQIIAELLRLARERDIVYAVPGHPFVGEATVTGLLTAAEAVGVPVQVVPGLSFVEPVLAAVGVDALDGLQVFDALQLNEFLHPPVNADTPLLVGQVYSRLMASALKLVLTAVYPDEHEVQLVHAAGEPNQVLETLPLYTIDRSEQIDHLTSLFVPPLPLASSLPALAETVAVLRSPDGCPWDQEQTPQSMRDGFLEEAYEALAALDADDTANLREELGDLLYHIVMQAQMASEAGDFTLNDVIAGIEAKLKRRHPHVWGDWEVSGTAEVLRNWEALKAEEKQDAPASLLDNIPLSLPALARAQKIQGKVRKVGFDWPAVAGVWDKLHEEVRELRQAETVEERADELGDLLFSAVNLARWLDVDAESALRTANARFEQRFRIVEQLVAEREQNWPDLDLDALEVLWQEAKTRLATGDLPAKVKKKHSGEESAS